MAPNDHDCYPYCHSNEVMCKAYVVTKYADKKPDL